MSNIYDFFYPLTSKYSVSEIASELSIHKGTVDRWILKKEVPPQYYFDLCRLAGVVIDYSQYSEKEKDQFFTAKETSQYCYTKLCQVLNDLDVDLSDYQFIEPSAGDGSFYNLLPEDRRTGVDIEPKCDGVIQSDFLTWQPQTDRNICVGNPPFGLRGQLALKFINHAAKFSDYVCFVLPQLFDSNGKGSCKSRVKGMSLIHTETVDSSFYYPGSKTVKVNVVFQIWSRLHQSNEKKVDLSGLIKLYSLSDGGTPDSTRNKKYHNICDYYLPSTCFGKDTIRVYSSFDDLPHRRGYGIIIESNRALLSSIIEKIDWSEVSFMSTNGAYNLRFDLIQNSISDELPDNLKSDPSACLEPFFAP